MKSLTRYRLIAASMTSASQPWARKKAMNGPTTASKKPRHVQSGVSRCFSSITASARSGSRANQVAIIPTVIHAP
jgi:hypothetical protein